MFEGPHNFETIGMCAVAAITQARHPLTSFQLFPFIEAGSEFRISDIAGRLNSVKSALSFHANPRVEDGVLVNLPGYGYWPRKLPPFRLESVDYWFTAKLSRQRLEAEVLLAFQKQAAPHVLSLGRLINRINNRGAVIRAHAYTIPRVIRAIEAHAPAIRPLEDQHEFYRYTPPAAAQPAFAATA